MKLRREETPLYSVLVNLIGSQTIFVINLAIGILIARALGPENKGVYVAATLVITVYSPIFIFGYTGGVLYNLLKKRLKLDSFFFTGLLAVLLISFLSASLIIILIKYGILGGILFNVNLNIKLYVFATIVAYLIREFIVVLLRSKNMFLNINIGTILARLILLVVCAYYFVFTYLDVLRIIQAHLFAIVVSIPYLLIVLFRHTNISFSFAGFNQILVPCRYGVKYWFSQIVSTSNDKFDQIYLSFALSSASLGLFTTAVGIAKLLARIPSSYTQVFFNQIAKKTDVEAILLLGKAHRITLALSFLMSILLCLVAKKLILLLYGNEYIVSLAVIAAYMPGLVCQICSRLLIKFYSAQGSPLKNAAIYTFGFICGLPFYLFLIPKLGLLGASVGSSVSYFLSFAFALYHLRKDYMVNLKDLFLLRNEDVEYIKRTSFNLVASLKK